MDVAKEAGVSKATVSRVLSGHPAISTVTKEKVNKVIKALNYKPNQHARSLASSKTKTLGVVLPIDVEASFNNPIYIQIMQGISKYAQSNDYYLMYVFGKGSEEEEHIKEFSAKSMVDGIIILKSEENDEIIHYLNQVQLPFVVIGRPINEKKVLWVDNDNFMATYKTVEALIYKGIKKIAFVGAKEKWTVSRERLKGYMKALDKKGIAYESKWVYQGGTFSEETGKRAAKVFLASDLPEAVIATDDLIAIGVQQALLEQGIKDIPIVGFNNTLLGIYQKPQLSSVEIYGEKLGLEAARLLITHIESNKSKSTYSIIETQLVKRGIFNAL